MPHYTFFMRMKSNIKNGDRISTGQLAQMIAAGFDVVDKRFDAVDKRFDAVDKKFEKLEERVDIVDARLGRIEADLGGLREEVVYRHEFDDVLGRVKYIERKLGIESGV